jgi:hypothetical protein
VVLACECADKVRTLNAAGRRPDASVCRAISRSDGKTKAMSLGTILLVVMVLMLVGTLPVWPHSRSWGYLPTSGLSLVLVVIIVLLVLGRV